MKKVLYATDYYKDFGARDISHAIKNNDQDAIQRAAKIMAPLVPKYYILIPVPGHTGIPLSTKKLCHAISKITGNIVCDIIRGKKRPSWHFLKKRGLLLTDEDFGFMVMDEVPKDLNILFVDNVYATGTTFRALRKLIPSAKILVYAIDKTLNDVL
jgi:predicted amidophosphoribosyltransferase